MTEEETRKKECPWHLLMMIYIQSKIDGPDKNALIDKATKLGFCSASDCALWVQTDDECEPQQHHKNPTVPDPEPKCYPAGHCGLKNK